MSYQRHLIANEIALLSANEMSYQRHLIANENTPVSIVIGIKGRRTLNESIITSLTKNNNNKNKQTKNNKTTNTHTLRVFYMFGKSDH